VERVKADVRDANRVATALDGIDVLVHQAARVGVGQSQYEIEEYVDANIRGTATLLEVLARRRRPLRKILVAGSMSSYGEGRYRCEACALEHATVTRTPEQLSRCQWEPVCCRCQHPLTPVPTDESTPLQSTSVYALTKVVQEELVLLFGRTYHVPAVSLRYFNVYGPRQSLSNPYTGVAAIFLSRLKNGQPPIVYEDGQQLRDFVYVTDVAEANLLAIERPGADGLAVNVASGRRVNVLEIAEQAAQRLQRQIAPSITGSARSGDIRHCFADVSRLEHALGLTTRVTFEAGFAQLCDWALGSEAADHFAEAERALRERGLL